MRVMLMEMVTLILQWQEEELIRCIGLKITVPKALQVIVLALIPILDRYLFLMLIKMEIWILLLLMQIQIKFCGMKTMVQQIHHLLQTFCQPAPMGLCPFMPQIWITTEILIF